MKKILYILFIAAALSPRAGALPNGENVGVPSNQEVIAPRAALPNGENVGVPSNQAVIAPRAVLPNGENVGVPSNGEVESAQLEDPLSEEEIKEWQGYATLDSIKVLYELFNSQMEIQSFKTLVFQAKAWELLVRNMREYKSCTAFARRGIVQDFIETDFKNCLQDILNQMPTVSFKESILNMPYEFDDMDLTGVKERAQIYKIDLSDGLVHDIVQALNAETVEDASRQIIDLIKEKIPGLSSGYGSIMAERLLGRILEEKNGDRQAKRDIILNLLRLQKNDGSENFCERALKTISDKSTVNLILNCIGEDGYVWTDKTASMAIYICAHNELSPAQILKIFSMLKEKDLQYKDFLAEIPSIYQGRSLDKEIIIEFSQYLKNNDFDEEWNEQLFPYMLKHHFNEMMEFACEPDRMNSLCEEFFSKSLKELLDSGEKEVTSEQITFFAFQAIESKYASQKMINAVLSSRQKIEQECLNKNIPLLIKHHLYSSYLNKEAVRIVSKRASGAHLMEAWGQSILYKSKEKQENLAFFLNETVLDVEQLDELMTALTKDSAPFLEKELAMALMKQKNFDTSLYKHWKNHTPRFCSPTFMLSSAHDDTICRRIATMCSQDISNIIVSGNTDSEIIEKYLRYVDKEKSSEQTEKIFDFYLNRYGLHDKTIELFQIIDNLQDRCGKENLQRVKDGFFGLTWAGKDHIDLASALFRADQELFPEIFQPWLDRNFTEIITKTKDSLKEAQKEFVIGQMENPDWVMQLTSRQEERAKEVVRMLKQAERIEER